METINKDVFKIKRLEKRAYSNIFATGNFNVKTLIAALIAEGYNEPKKVRLENSANPFVLKSKKYVQLYDYSSSTFGESGKLEIVYQLYNSVADKFIKLEKYQYDFAVEFSKMMNVRRSLDKQNSDKLYFELMY